MNSHSSKKKFFLIFFFFVLIITASLSVYFIYQQYFTKNQITPNTTLTLAPNTQSAEIGSKISFDIRMSPGDNKVNYIRLALKFDPTKLNTTTDNFTVNATSALSISEKPTIKNDTFTVTLSTGKDQGNAITTDTNIGTITFDVIGTSVTPTDITFDPSTQINSTQKFMISTNENLFLSGNSASITILENPSSTDSASSSSTLETNNTISEIPVCSSLGLDVAASGIAPYTINFTASGTDIDGTIEKASFDFGDGNYEEITSGGGISTDTVDVTMAHIYDAPGEYVADVTLTDDTNQTSDTNSCTAAITITDEYGNITANNMNDENTSGPDDYSSNEASSSAQLNPSPTIAPTGPTEAIMGVGAIGGILVLIGILLFFAL